MKIKHSDNQRNVAISASSEGTESLISKFARNVCDTLWEDYNIWAEWDKTSEGILISMSDDPDSDTQATFTIPEYELDFDNYDFDDMVDDYVENLQEEFIGSTSSEDIDSATNIPDIQSYYTDDAVSRYIHSLIPEIADLLESEGYDVTFDQDANNLYISIYPSGEDYEDGTYTFPKSALTCKDVKTDASNIVEILMNRASFEDLYACDSITAGEDNYNTNKCINCSTLEDKRNPNNPYRYITKHGIGPGTLPKDVKLIDWEDLDNYRTAIYLDRPLSSKELDEYDIYPESIQASSSEYDTVSSCDVKSEANRLFKYLKDYGAISITNNIDTIDIKFSNDPDISDVTLIYHAIISQGYSQIAHHSRDPVVFEFISENGCICVKLLSYDSSEIVVEVSQEPEYISSSYDYDDEYVSEWEEIASKVVPDSDGFWTDYTLYRNVITGQYICMFGDKDIYEPDEDYADWSGDSEKLAREWFDNYQGDAPYEDPYDDYLNSQTGVTGRF